MRYQSLPCRWTPLPLSSLLPSIHSPLTEKDQERKGAREIEPLELSDETVVSAISAMAGGANGLIARSGEYWRSWVVAELASLLSTTHNRVIALGMYEDDKVGEAEGEGGRLRGYGVLRLWAPSEEGGPWGLHVLDYVCSDGGGEGEGEGLVRMCVHAARMLGEKEGEGKGGRRIEVRWPGCVPLPGGVKGQGRQDDAGWMYR